MIIAAIISFLAILAWDVISDYKKWLEDRKIIHKSFAELGVRILLLVIPGILFYLPTPPDTVIFTIVKIVLIALMIGFNYWNLMDGFYNVFRNQNWFFTGSEDGEDDADTDNFLQSIPLWLHVVIKVGISAASIFFYILIL